jgi:hypothetical protein
MRCSEKSQIPMRDAILQRYPTWSLAHWCVVTFAASFFILALQPNARLTDLTVPLGGENAHVARTLAMRGEFANPFTTLDTGTTAHAAPVYPFLYSLVLRVFGTGYPALLILWTASIGLVALQMALLPVISHRSGLGILPGIISAAMGSAFLFVTIDTRSESFLAGALLLVAWLLTMQFCSGHASRLVLVELGVLWGVLILTNPVMLALLCAWSLCLLLARQGVDRREFMKGYAAIVGIAMLIVFPWIVRNYARFGAFVFVRDNLGLELYTSNNSCAAPTLLENLNSGCHERTHPNRGMGVAAEMAAMGELQFNRAKLREAVLWIEGNPQAFLLLTMRRVRWFWFPSLGNPWDTFPVWLITLLSTAGLWLIAKKNRIAAWLLASTWLCFPLIYYLVQFDPRYRYPIYWTTLLATGCCLAELVVKLPASRLQTKTANAAKSLQEN